MSDQDKVKHGIACIAELRRLAKAGQASRDEEQMAGFFRKIDQIGGFGLERLQGAEEPPTAKTPLLTVQHIRAQLDKVRDAQKAG